MDVDELGAKAWAVIFLFLLFSVACITRRIANCCLTSQRSRLRDFYEDEYRAGDTVNTLLLPRTQRVSWNPRA